MVEYLTYTEIAANYSCSNVSNGTEPLFTYTGQCQLINDGSKYSEAWRVKFKTSGTLTINKKVKVDAFLVGGGTRGSDDHRGDAGKGGATIVSSGIVLSQGTTYTVTVGGPSADTVFNNVTASAGGTTVANGQCEFLETLEDGTCKYNDNGYQGHYGANGDITAYGGGRRASGGDCYGASTTPSTAGATNTGAGGGGGGIWYGACNDGQGNLYGFGTGASDGGSGIVILRGTR